jgi:predicted alpha/beta-fold hydrolase
LAHVGAACPFIAAASVSNGYDIEAGTAVMGATARGVTAQFLKDVLVQDARMQEARTLAAQAGVDIDFEAAMRSRTLGDLEAHLVAPAYGYKRVADYYADDSCANKIHGVASPLLCIATKDDPLVDVAMTRIPVRAAGSNPHVVTVVTRDGGHIGWIDDRRQDPWYARLFFEFAAAHAATKRRLTPSTSS